MTSSLRRKGSDSHAIVVCFGFLAASHVGSWRRQWQPKCSCLENPRDRGAWWAAVYGLAQSQTQLKQLSSSILAHWPGMEHAPTALESKFLTSESPGKFLDWLLNNVIISLICLALSGFQSHCYFTHMILIFPQCYEVLSVPYYSQTETQRS